MYYLIIDEKQVGPVPFEQLTTYGIGPDTMVWKEGMPQWAPASTLQELTPLFNTGAPFSGNPYGQPQQPCQQPWQQPQQQPYQQQQQPWQQPYSGNLYGQPADNEPRPGDPGYTPNLGGCQQPRQQPQQQFQQQPQQQPWQHPQQPTQPTWEQPQQQPWQQPQQPQQPWQQPGQPWQPQNNYERKSQYMTLAIIGTVLGIFSCLGLIFGIIAITKANSANKFYAMGDEVTAASNDSSARTFSIIALVLDGLGILISLIALGS